MRIGVISDSHGNLEALKTSLQTIGDVDLIIHAGDVLYHPPRLGFTQGYDLTGAADFLNSLKTPLIIAQGNCDAQVYEELLHVPVNSPYAYVSLDGTAIIASHGHLIPHNKFIDLAVQLGARYAISGHTHLPVLEKISGVIFMNPGSISLPKTSVASAGIITPSGARIVSIVDGSTIFEISL